LSHINVVLSQFCSCLGAKSFTYKIMTAEDKNENKICQVNIHKENHTRNMYVSTNVKWPQNSQQLWK